MNLTQQIKEDLIKSLKKKDSFSASTLRLTLAAIHNSEIAKKKELSNEEVTDLINKEIKKRKDSISEYKKGQREDLVQKEQKEIEVLLKYLPKQLSEKEIEDLVKKTIKEVGATSRSDIGKVMSKLMPQVAGKADGGLVNQITNRELSK